MESGEEKNWWKDKLKGAEVEPNQQVWENINAALDKDLEVRQIKRRLVYFQWAAAAAIFLLIGLSYASFQYMQQQEVVRQELANAYNLLQQKQTSINEQKVEENKVANRSILETENKIERDNQKRIESNTLQSNRTNIKQKNVFFESGISSTNQKSLVKFAPIKRYDVASDDLTFSQPNSFNNKIGFNHNTNNNLPEGKTNLEVANLNIKPEENLNEEKTELVSPLLIEQKESTLALSDSKEEAKKTEEERFWTSLGFSAGSFNNVTPTNSGAPATAFRSSLAGQTASEESNSPGYTYSVNLLVGTKVSERWIVQGGVSYMNQISDYTANSVLAENTTLQVASVNQFEKNKDNADASILASTPYNVNNTIEIISFPLQAGYIIFEKKWGLVVNTGIATDLFLQNTLSPNAENIASTTTGRGSDSPYRPLNFAGIVGTEVSYRFGTQYRISLAPGIRYPFQSIYKDNLEVKSTPLTFDLGLRFKYIFK